MRNQVILGDCIEMMKEIPSGSVDMILSDKPYEETQHDLDVKIPFDLMWDQYLRIIKPNGCIALYAQGLFYVDLVQSMRGLFRYDLIWNKVLTTGFLNAKRMPLRVHEQVAIFYKKLPIYNPQMTEGKPLHSKGISYKDKPIKNQNYGKFEATDDARAGSTQKYPTSIITFPKPHPSVARHRTEKSVPFGEWLIKTYTNPGDLVLDDTCGCGTTGEAAVNTGRDYILIDNDLQEWTKSVKNVKEAHARRNGQF
jgi:site-specific DNA-methyltransferase (adenine-specific)